VQQDLITDFSDAVVGIDLDGNPGIAYSRGAVALGGTSAVFAAPGLRLPRLSLEPRGSDQALRIDATPGVPIDNQNYYSGIALAFGRDEGVCVDATGYTGVRFTLEGTPGTCQLMFQVLISQDFRIGENGPGACTLGELCYPPFSEPLVVDGGVGAEPSRFDVRFAALTRPGNPVARIDAQTIKSIVNVGWKLFAPLVGPPCQASMLLDEVAFFR
jgi:hypothetical protein